MNSPSKRLGRRRFLAFAAFVALTASGCGWLLGGGNNPRPDDPTAIRPNPPTEAVPWTSLSWDDVTFERPRGNSAEQWDQPTAVAAGPGGFVAVGSNDNAMNYVGRIWRSDDARDWRLVEDPILDGLQLEDIAADGSRYVAIGTRSSNPNAPVASVLTSTDGASWTEVETIEGAWATRVVATPGGLAMVVQVDDSTDLLFSTDGATWTRMTGAELAVDARVLDIGWEHDGWLAAGSVGNRAALWRSPDGARWTEEQLPASEPVSGLIDVVAYRVVPGRRATLVLGIERGPSCAEDDDFCSKYQAAWSWTAGGGWARLPRSTWILDRGFGVEVYPAGDAGFLYLIGNEARQSSDGWGWEPVKASGGTDALTSDVIVAGDRLVAVGVPTDGDDLIGWFGSAKIGR